MPARPARGLFRDAHRRQPTTEHNLLLRAETLKTPAVIIEAHSRDEHWLGEREIIELKRRQPSLAALSALQPAHDSVFARVLSS